MSASPSARAAAIGGDDYQHAFTWLQALGLLAADSGVVSIGMEVADAGNVDDVVVRHARAPTQWHQVKFNVTAGSVLTHEWFTDRDGRSASPLERFASSFRKLSAPGGPAELYLQTARVVDPDDPVLRLLATRDGRLTPRLAAAAPGSRAGRIRAGWAELLDMQEPELIELLEHLHIHAGRWTYAELKRACGYRMEGAGLKGSDLAVELGIGAIRDLIASGARQLDREGMQELIRLRELRSARARATLLVQAIDHRPWPEAATVALDWVELFQGEEPPARRQLIDPDGWNGTLRAQLTDAAAHIRKLGYTDVLLHGALRLGSALAAGHALSAPAGFRLAVESRGEEWAAGPGGQALVVVADDPRPFGGGDDVAVGVSVSDDITADVVEFLESSELPVGAFVNLRPQDGYGHHALSPASAESWARGVVGHVRRLARSHPGTVHLFLLGPMPAMALLGHVYNRVPTTQVHEDLGPGRGYAPSFLLPAT